MKGGAGSAYFRSRSAEPWHISRNLRPELGEQMRVRKEEIVGGTVGKLVRLFS